MTVASELSGSLRGEGWNVSGTASQIVPVIVGANEDALTAAAFLREQGFAVRAVRPPTVPAGTARLRLSLTARVTREEVAGVVAALQNWRGSQSSLNAREIAASRA